MLLDRLQKASFKGVGFLVERSSITFGQKTVVHQYPNSSRTEVEFLGASEDVFTLTLYVHSVENDYVEKRNSLKAALLSKDPGLLVHPLEGTILCSVVNQVGLEEEDRLHGVAKFSATFQKTSKKLFPTSSILNNSVIRTLFSAIGVDLADAVKNDFQIDGTFNQVFKNTKDRVDSLNEILLTVQTLAPLSSDLAAEFNSEFLNFKNQVVSMSQTPSVLASNLELLFNKTDGIAESVLDNVTIYRTFFNFMDDLDVVPSLTVQQDRINENNRILKQYVQAKALTLSYSAISAVDFEDDVQLNFYEDLLEAQYQKIIKFSDSNVSFELSKIRNEARIYFDNQSVRRVITIDVPKMPLTKLTYLLYESLTDFNKLFELNNRLDPSLYEGQIRVLTNE